MSLADLREKYGKKRNSKHVINSAIRAEIPGGGKILDAGHLLSMRIPHLPPHYQNKMYDALDLMLLAMGEMKASIAQKYGVGTGEPMPPQPEERKPDGPAMPEEERPALPEEERPAMPEEERRNQAVTVRLTAEEIFRLTEPEHKKAVAETIRELVEKGLQKPLNNKE